MLCSDSAEIKIKDKSTKTKVRENRKILKNL